MKLSIKPEDKTQPEKIELELHPALIRRLKACAQSLNDSSVSYVAAQIFEQALPPEKGPAKPQTKPAEKPKKERPAAVSGAA